MNSMCKSPEAGSSCQEMTYTPEAQRLREERVERWVWRGKKGANLMRLCGSHYGISPNSSGKGGVCTNLIRSALFKTPLLWSGGSIGGLARMDSRKPIRRLLRLSCEGRR